MWVKLAILLLGVVLLGGAVQKFGLPTAPVKQALAPSPAPAPATPAPAQQQSAAVQPAAPAPVATPAPAPAAPASPAPSSPAPAQSVPAQPAPAPAAEAPKPAEMVPPTFDVVRVEPDGTSVVAGRAQPGTQVQLLLNGAVHDTATADRSGQFAMVPPRFPAGNHEVTLALVAPDGRKDVSRQTVTLSIPGSSGGEVIVALAQPDKPTELLSRPKAVAAPAPQPAAPQTAAAPAASATPAPPAPAPGTPAPDAGPRPRIVVATVEAEDSGKFFATGQAAGNATVRLYLNDTFLATARAGGDGRWSFTIIRGLEPGAYRVRLDDVDPASGTVLSRAEVPFTFSPRVAAAAPLAPAPARPAPSPAPAAPQQAPVAGAPAAQPSAPVVAATPSPATTQGPDAVVAEIRSTMVARGDSLWRISRRVYGRGTRYTVIYEANAQQIRDPKLIYPGQMFVLPGDKQP